MNEINIILNAKVPFPLPSAWYFLLKHPPPPEDPSGGVFYPRIVLSPEKESRLVNITWHGFSRGGFVSPSPNPQAGGPPLVGCSRLLIQYIRTYPPYRRPFLHPQPEDAPCRGDRDPLITVIVKIHLLKIVLLLRLILFSFMYRLLEIFFMTCTTQE